MSEYFVVDTIICNVYITLYLTRSSVVFINFFPTPTGMLWMLNHKDLLAACGGVCGRVVNTSNPGSGGPGSSLARRAVSLDKELYSTLSLFNQEYKWVPATYCWGIIIRWTSIPSWGGGKGVAILVFYYYTSWSLTFNPGWDEYWKLKKYINSSDLIFCNCARINLMFMKTVQKHSVSFNPKRQGTSKFFFVWDCNYYSLTILFTCFKVILKI